MAMSMNETLTLLTALISTIKYRQMFRFQEWSPFYRHCTAGIIISCVYLVIGKAQLMQQAEVRCIILLSSKAKAL